MRIQYENYLLTKAFSSSYVQNGSLTFSDFCGLPVDRVLEKPHRNYYIIDRLWLDKSLF